MIPDIDTHWALKKGAGPDVIFDIESFLEDETTEYSGIRCPLCHWRPDASSRWCCDGSYGPERFPGGCGMLWNTFATRGRCPGCAHQWRWTSCLRCAEWSLHEEWYVTGEA